MKLIDKNTGKTLYAVLGGENLTLDEAIEWAGAEVTEDQNYIISRSGNRIFDRHQPFEEHYRLLSC